MMARMLPIPLSLEAMEAAPVRELPVGPSWQYEPKWDGFRCMAFRDRGSVHLQSKSGQSLDRYFPEVLAALGALPLTRFVMDGELVIPVSGGLSFSQLQMRLHPAASRVLRLSRETPARYMVFDWLAEGGRTLLTTPLGERRTRLEAVAASAFPGSTGSVVLSPMSLERSVAQGWVDGGVAGLDGAIAKHRDAAYQAGVRDPSVMVKVKRIRTADCVVGGFRYGTGSTQVGSLLLGLYDAAGLLHHVGFTASIAHADRPALTKRLDRLRGPSRFTGRAPGAPSRWSTERSSAWEPVAPSLVVEVAFDHVTDERFRHGTKLLRFRTDKKPVRCTIDQIAPLALPAKPGQGVTALRASKTLKKRTAVATVRSSRAPPATRPQAHRNAMRRRS